MNEEPKAPEEGVTSPVVSEEPFVTGATPEQPKPTAVVSPPPRRRKSKMQLIIVLVVVFLMLVAVGLWWYFIYNKPAEEQPAQSQPDTTVQPITNVPKHFIQLGSEVGYINETGDYKDITTLKDTEMVVEAIVLNDKPELRYVDTKSNSQYPEELTAYGKINESGKTEMFKFPAGTDYFYSNPILSPDGTTIVVEKSDTNTGDMLELTAINIADGKARKVYDPSTRGGLYHAVDWADDNTLLLQSQTCRQCDGPSMPELTKLNLSDGKISSFYKGPNTLEFAQFMRVPDSDEIFLFGGDFVMGLDPGYALGPYSAYKINKLTGAASKIIDIQEDETAGLVGWTEDKQGLFIEHTGAVKTDDDDADYQNETGNYNELPPKVWVIKNGSKTDLAFNSEHIIKDSFINYIFEENGNTFAIVDTFNNSVPDDISTTARLIRKKGTSETTEVMNEVTAKTNRLGVFYTTLVGN